MKSIHIKGHRITATGTYGLLILGAVLMLFPFYWMVVTSLQFTHSYFTGLVPSEVTLYNYLTAFKATSFSLWLVNTMLYCAITILSNLVLALLAGYALSRLRFRGRDRLVFLIVITMLIPGFLVLIPQYLLILYLGLTNSVLGLSAPYLIDAFNIFLVRQYMLSIPKDLDDAGRVDGCSEFQILTKIIAPLCKPVIMLVTTFTFLVRWNDFLWPLIVVTNSDRYVLTIGLSSLDTARGASDMGLIMAIATLCFIGPLLVFVLFQRYLVKGMLLTGIKA
jgi:multiple sugar transport system permease protein